MKRVIFLFTMLSLLSLTGFAKDPLASGKTHCCLGTYLIQDAVEPLMVNGNALPTYLVTYENSDITVRIGVDKSDKKCTRYLVVSGNLSIQYECNSKFFGVNKIDREYKKDGLNTSDQAINREEYFHQKIISQNKLAQIDQIKLISVYFPKLVNDYEQVFAVR